MQLESARAAALAHVGLTLHGEPRCTTARLRNDLPRRMRDYIERHVIDLADVRFCPGRRAHLEGT